MINVGRAAKFSYVKSHNACSCMVTGEWNGLK